MFFIVKFQKIIYIQDFMFISFLNLLLEDKIQLFVHDARCESDKSIKFEDFVPDHYIAVT